MEIKRANYLASFIHFFLLKHRYVDAAVSHSMWVNLQAPDLRDAYNKGKFPQEGWENEHRTREYQSLKLMRKKLWHSFLLVISLGSVVLIYGIVGGDLNLDTKSVHSRINTFIGASVIFWATIFQLVGRPERTYKGRTLIEVLHKVVFFVLLVIGIVLTLGGIVQ